ERMRKHLTPEICGKWAIRPARVLHISSTALGWTPLEPGARLKAPFGRALGATQTSERISEAVHGYCYAASVRFAPGASRTVLLDGSRHQRAGKRSFISRSGRYP